MNLNHMLQNVWRQEGLFYILPTIALYHNDDLFTDDYGIIFSWALWSYSIEVWN
jgi:hypothetical protein